MKDKKRVIISTDAEKFFFLNAISSLNKLSREETYFNIIKAMYKNLTVNIILNITNHQGNADQNHNEIPPHTCYNGYYTK